MTLALVVFAVIPTAYVLLREAFRRRVARAALARVAEATHLTGEGEDVGTLVLMLRERFDNATIERVVEQKLRAEADVSRALGRRLFVELGLVERYATTLRGGRRWSERVHAAEMLGVAGDAGAVTALVAAMNDRFEDELSVKAAATKALAALRDPTAVPLLIAELERTSEGASRSIAEALVAFGDLSIDPLLRVLSSPTHPSTRVWVARILGRIKDPRATDDLVVRLHDRDDLLRIAAAEALGLIADARATQPLIRAMLRDPAPQVRAHAAGSVARIEGERAVDVLVAALADPDYATRLRALEAFEAIRIKDTSPLESALRDPNGDVRRRAALALERVGYLDRIIGELTSVEHGVRKRAYDAVSELGRVGLLDSVVAYVHHGSFEVRAQVARMCGELGVARVAPILRNRLDDESWPVRAALCEALGRLKAPETAAALIPILVDAEESVREAAAEALTAFPPGELTLYVDALATAFDRGTVIVRKHMVVVLSRIEAEGADALLVRATLDSSDAVRQRAVTALGDRGGDVMVEPLLARLTDASLEVRMAAVAGLGSAASTEAFEGLLGALAGAPPNVRDRIAESLSRGAREQLFMRLDEIERNPSLDVRLGIAWTLGKCGDVVGIATLSRFLADGNALLRASAAGALAKISDSAAREALLRAAEDPNGRVRAAVVNALGRAPAGESRVVSALERSVRDPDAFVRNRALVSLACVARGAIEGQLLELGRDAHPAARLVAGGLVGTESVLAGILDELSLPGRMDEVVAFLAHEDPAVRIAFFAALHLEDSPTSAPLSLDTLGLVSQYESLLRSSLDIASRRFAVRALGRLRGGRSADVLADALCSDPAEDVRIQAAEALENHAGEALARNALVRAVGDPSAQVARRALHALAGRREAEIGVALARRLGAGPRDIQELVESTLAALHRDDPWPFLDWMMGVEVPELLLPAVRVLHAMATPSAVPLLEELARSTSAPVRAAAVKALGAVPSPNMVFIENMVSDPSEEVRLGVLDTMVWTGDSLLRASMMKNDPSVRVRAALATSLHRFAGPATKIVLKVLSSLVEDASPRVRAAALATMIASSDPAGLQAFARAWPKTALDVRFELRAEPRGAELTELLLKRLSSADASDVRAAAILAMSALGCEGLASRLVGSLHDPSPDVRVAVIHVLAVDADPAVRARVNEMLSDLDVAVRDVARRAVVRTIG